MDNMAVTDNRVNDMSISPIPIRTRHLLGRFWETSPLAFKKSPSFLSKIPDFDDLDRAFVLVIDRGTERVPILQIERLSSLGLRLIIHFTHLCEDAGLCHLRRNSSALLPILKGAPGHSKFHGRFFSRPRMFRPPIKQNLRKVYPRRKQFRTLLPSPTVPGPRRTRSSAGGLRHLTLRDRITPLLSRSCRPRPHPRSRFTETPPYLPSRGPQTQRAAHPGHRQTLSLQVPRAQKRPAQEMAARLLSNQPRENRGLCCWVHKQQIAERRRRKYFADRAALFGKAKSNHDQAPFHLSCRTTRRSRRAPSRV